MRLVASSVARHWRAFGYRPEDAVTEGWHVRVGGFGELPGVPLFTAGRCGIGVGGDAEQRFDPLAAVGPVVGQGLAGPLAGEQHPPAAAAESFPLVDLVLAVARLEPRARLLGLDAVEQPVGAPLRARGRHAGHRRQPGLPAMGFGGDGRASTTAAGRRIRRVTRQLMCDADSPGDVRQAPELRRRAVGA